MTVKTLVLYTGHELEGGPKTENTEFFVRNGVFESGEVDFLFIFNCEEKEDNGLVNIITSNKNCKIIYRENKGYDFGAWTYGLSQVNVDDYEYFIFINQSVKGPFLPNWHNEMDKPWFRIFTDMINEETKLVGASINFYRGRAHVQSMITATDRVGLNIAIHNDVFDSAYYNSSLMLWEVVEKSEIKWSEAIIKAGYNITSTLSAYAGMDFRNRSWCKNNTDHLMANQQQDGDPSYNNAYFGLNINPVEAIFIKTNRGIDPSQLFCHTVWMNRRKHDYNWRIE